MSFHFTPFSPERNVRELRKFLSLPVKPLCLRHLCGLRASDHASILLYTRDLAVRTAHAYAAFFDPVLQHCLDKVPRLPWAKEVSLREFQFCVQLQEVAERYVWERKNFLGTESLLEDAVEAGKGSKGTTAPFWSGDAERGVVPDRRGVLQDVSASPSFSLFSACASDEGDITMSPHHSPLATSFSLEEGKGPKYSNDTAAAGASHLLPLTSSHPPIETSTVPPPPPPPHPNFASTRVPGDASTFRHSTSFRCNTYASPTRDRIVSALQRGEITLSSLSFETALALLRPEQSLLHILVNETRIDSLPLNVWFSQFCQRRVAWRVLHEHLLHVLRPLVFPNVIEADVDVLDLVYHAADVVTGIHTSQPITTPEEKLLLSAALQQKILHHPPAVPFLSASNSHFSLASTIDHASKLSSPSVASTTSTSTAADDSAPTLFPLPSRPTMYAVDSHLKYVFRELLKNAYMATASIHPQIELDIQVAQDTEWAIIDIVDHGHGILEENKNNIWRFGFTTTGTTESVLGGFGVGLPTSKVYMDLWGGCMEVYSVFGTGTTVRVRYPKAPTEQLAPDTPEYWPSSMVGGKSHTIPTSMKM